LAAINRSDNQSAKAFLSRTVDKIRPPFGKRRMDFPRTALFLGTTNFRDYLNDPTGNRRYWPVLVKQCDFEALERDRDQLWAEALFMYEFAPEILCLDGQADLQASRIQEIRRMEDEGDGMAEELLSWQNSDDDETPKQQFTLHQLFKGPWSGFQPNRGNMMRAAIVLRSMGYEKYHTAKGNLWSKKEGH
jgi:predicted P-loop ATPase